FATQPGADAVVVEAALQSGTGPADYTPSSGPPPETVASFVVLPNAASEMERGVRLACTERLAEALSEMSASIHGALFTGEHHVPLFPGGDDPARRPGRRSGSPGCVPPPGSPATGRDCRERSWVWLDFHA